MQGAVQLGDGDFLACAKSSVKDAGNRQTAKVVAVIEVGDENLQRAIGIAPRLRNGAHDRLEQRPQILSAAFYFFGGCAGLGIGV